jgi:hypothetical protein
MLDAASVGEAHYRRKLNVNVYGISNEKNQTSSAYVYTPSVGGKGVNHVLSFELHHHTSSDTGGMDLCAHFDGAGSQNNNWGVCKMMMMFTDRDSPYHVYRTVTEIRAQHGHSYSLIDRNAGRLALSYIDAGATLLLNATILT